MSRGQLGEWDAETQTWTIRWAGPWRIAVMEQLFSAAVIVDAGDKLGITDRWDYPNLLEAALAAHAWDGLYPDTEPTGWIRHVRTGRRRDADGNEWVGR